MAPDGRLWTCDGQSLLCLSDEGVVERVVGEPPDACDLGEVAGMTVDHRGYAYLVSAGTGAIHVFDRSGTLVHVCEPLPTDFQSNLSDVAITVAGDGSVFASGAMRIRDDATYLRFTPDGRRVGFERAGPPGEWHFKPASQERWITHFDEFCLAGVDGKIIRSIQRRPDNRWLERVHKIAIAPIGAVVVSSFESRRFASFGSPTLNVYAAGGEPVRTITLPFESYISAMAFDGHRVIASRDNDLVIVDAESQVMQQFTPTATVNYPSWEPFFSPEGDEIWIRERGSATLHRYRAP